MSITPAVSPISSAKFRPFSGRFWTAVSVRSLESVLDSASRSGIAPFTSMASFPVPSFRVTSIDSRCATSRWTCWTRGENRVASTFSS